MPVPLVVRRNPFAVSTTAPAMGNPLDASVTVPCNVPFGNAGHAANLNVPIRVSQPSALLVE